jgi:uncharacterized protein
MKIKEIKNIKLKNPILVLGFLGVGGIGVAAALHMIKELKMEYCGYIYSEKFYPTTIIHEGIPLPPVRIYKSKENNICVIVSELAIPSKLINELSKEILNYAIKNKFRRIYGFGGLNISVAPEDIDKILGIGTTEEDRKILEKNDIIIIREGVTSGVVSGVLSSCYEKCFSSIFLFTPSRKMVVDFLSAAAVLNAFSKIEKIKINVDSLIKEGKIYEEKMNKILETLKKDKEEYKRFEETIYR